MEKARPIPLYTPLMILMIAVIMSVVEPEKFQLSITAINNWIINEFAWLFSLSSVFFVGTCAYVYFSPIGKVKIGGPTAIPLMSKRNWFAITLCTTIAVGLLFWSTGEPIFHLYEPPTSKGIIPASDAARKFALSTLYLHWSFTPYAIYTVPSLAFALAYYNYSKPHSVGGMLAPLFGDKTTGRWGQLIDVIALFALISGMSSGMGQGLLTLAGGLHETLGISTSPHILALITIAIVVTVVVSAASGLMKGIRILSDLNLKFFLALGIFVIIFGPTHYSLSAGVDALGDYLSNFLEKSLFTGELGNDSWPRWWTNFYWAQWLSWAPITALFLGRISRGYTVREFILNTMVFPSMFTILWMTFFGGMSLYYDKILDGALKSSLDNNGVESVAYLVLNQLPASTFIIFFFIIISFVSYVTAADSNTEAIASVCRSRTANDAVESSGLGIKMLYIGMVGVIAWFMVSFSGVNGIKMLANLGALPGLIIVLAAMASLWHIAWKTNNASK